jgi:hypothetical protein
MVLLLGLGCDAGPSPLPAVIATSVDGAQAVAPTATVVVRFSGALAAGSVDGSVLLVRGEPDGRLVAALGRPPPPKALLDELVSVRLVVDGDEAHLTPRRALAPGQRYTLVVGPRVIVAGAQLGRPFERAFTTGALGDGAPVLSLLAPADGATGVVRNLREVLASWSKRVSSPTAITLVDDGGESQPATVDEAGCERCVRLRLSAPLAANARFSLRASPDARDRMGATAFGDPSGFSTGSELRAGPTRLHDLALELADGCIGARFASDFPTSALMCVAVEGEGHRRCVTDPPARDHALGIAVDDLDGALTYDVSAWDETTLPPADTTGPVDAPSPLQLAITEVLTRPLGPRLRQQFVEVLNLGAAPVELAGVALVDAAGRNTLSTATLGPGAVALLVPSGFTDDGADPAPAAGALIIHVDESHLGGRGIPAAGEPLWLEDANHRRVSAWGGFPLSLAPGQSVTRVSPRACDVPSSFVATPSGRSTPGAP